MIYTAPRSSFDLQKYRAKITLKINGVFLFCDKWYTTYIKYKAILAIWNERPKLKTRQSK